jgi:hypothetical protein
LFEEFNRSTIKPTPPSAIISFRSSSPFDKVN